MTSTGILVMAGREICNSENGRWQLCFTELLFATEEIMGSEILIIFSDPNSLRPQFLANNGNFPILGYGVLYVGSSRFNVFIVLLHIKDKSKE